MWGVGGAEKVRESDPSRRGAVAHCRKRRSIVRRKENGGRGGRRRKRREEGETLRPRYLLGAGEGVVEARHVGHDGLLVRTGRAHNVCGGGRGGGEREEEGGAGFVKLEQQFDRDGAGRRAGGRALRAGGGASLSWTGRRSRDTSLRSRQLNGHKGLNGVS